MLKKIFICCLMFCFPGCLTNKVSVPAPAASPPSAPKRFITIEHFEGASRVRLRNVPRPFLLPSEIKQIEQELKEFSPRELEMLKKLLEQIYGPAVPPIIA